VVPPALSEVRKPVLRRKLNDLVENRPEVAEKRVSENQSHSEVVQPVREEIVIQVVPKTGESQFAIVVVGVHTLLNHLSQARVEEAKGTAADIRSLVEQANEYAVIHKEHSHDAPVEALHPDVLESLKVRVQVLERCHEEYCAHN